MPIGEPCVGLAARGQIDAPALVDGDQVDGELVAEDTAKPGPDGEEAPRAAGAADVLRMDGEVVDLARPPRGRPGRHAEATRGAAVADDGRRRRIQSELFPEVGRDLERLGSFDETSLVPQEVRDRFEPLRVRLVSHGGASDRGAHGGGGRPRGSVRSSARTRA